MNNLKYFITLDNFYKLNDVIIKNKIFYLFGDFTKKQKIIILNKIKKNKGVLSLFFYKNINYIITTYNYNIHFDYINSISTNIKYIHII